MHRRTYFQKHYNKAELQQGVMLCRLCHKGIHTLYDEMTLAKRLNSLQQLQADDKISQHVDWVTIEVSLVIYIFFCVNWTTRKEAKFINQRPLLRIFN